MGIQAYMYELRLMNIDMVDASKYMKNKEIINAMLNRSREIGGGAEILGLVVVRQQLGVFPRYDALWGGEAVIVARQLGLSGVWAIVIQRGINESIVISTLEAQAQIHAHVNPSKKSNPEITGRGGEQAYRNQKDLSETNMDDPVEKAKFIEQLVKEVGSQHAAANRLNTSRSTVQNALRLLKLPDHVLAYVSKGIINPGAARALSYIKNEKLRDGILNSLASGALSVRDVEDIVSGKLVLDDLDLRDLEIRRLEKLLSEQIGGKVTIGIKDGSSQSGTLSLSLHDLSISEVLAKLIDAGFRSPSLRVVRHTVRDISTIQVAFENFNELGSLLASIGYPAEQLFDTNYE